MSYLDEVKKELAPYLQLAQETWNETPAILLEEVPTIQVKFNIKGFAHDGKRFVNRPAKQVAKEIMEELTTHRKTCRDCGEGVLNLWRKLYYLKRITGYWNWYAKEDARSWKYEHGQYEKVDGRWVHVGTISLTVEDLLIPPDEVEKKVNPGRYREWVKLSNQVRREYSG